MKGPQVYQSLTVMCLISLTLGKVFIILIVYIYREPPNVSPAWAYVIS